MAGRPRKQTSIDKDVPVDLPTIAKFLGCNVSNIKRWRDEGMPYTEQPNGEKLYPVAACVEWRIAQEVARAIKAQPTDDIKQAKSRKESALASLAEYRLLDAQGKIVLVDDATHILTDYLVTIRDTVKAAEGRYTEKLHGKASLSETQIAISEMFNTILTEIQLVIQDAKQPRT